KYTSATYTVTMSGTLLSDALGGLTVGRTNYIGVGGYLADLIDTNSPPVDWSRYKGIFGIRSKHTMSSILDGTSNVLMFGEAIGGRVGPRRDYGFTWMGTGFLTTGFGIGNKDWVKFSSEHPGIVQFALADGSVRNVNVNIDFVTYVHFSEMQDGNTISVN